MTTEMISTATREIQYRDAINEAIRQEMERDETVIIISHKFLKGLIHWRIRQMIAVITDHFLGNTQNNFQ